MVFIISFILALLIFASSIGFVKARHKGTVAAAGVIALAFISSLPAIGALTGASLNYTFSGSLVTGPVGVLVDPLSGWFILLINFTFITSALYGKKYMELYLGQPSKLALHWISFLTTQCGILSVTVLQNSISFLIAWEVMAISAFLLVIFEGQKSATIKAGINYIIQSHVAVIFLTIAFIWVSEKTNSFDFSAISHFASTEKHLASFVLMLIFFVGFGIKAGFVPFHTWLPHAHPVAPSHVSGMMSGVLIKIGIYGLFRILFLLNVNYLATGCFLLIVSVVTGIYGVMLALIQHNLKKLLAYHSIENIGIIGTGAAVGYIGMGMGNQGLAVLGFAGALLHTLNHSLFKSLLFYAAGNIYHATHSVDIEQFGGIIKKMPHTAILFLIAALAICGLPPFNGFISEFIIYNSLFSGLLSSTYPFMIVFVVAIFGLAILGGLAIFCFTKAFGTIFLGTPRQKLKKVPIETSWQMLLPMYIIVVPIIAIGLFPQVFVKMLSAPVGQLSGLELKSLVEINAGNLHLINNVGYASLGFIFLLVLIFAVRRMLISKTKTKIGATWQCGYAAANSRMQYTASSFVRNYSKLAEPMLLIKRHREDVRGIFPGKASHATHPSDKTEEYLINWPIMQLRYFLGKFSFLQNGRLQYYILYGLLFVTLLIGVPLVIYFFDSLVEFLN